MAIDQSIINFAVYEDSIEYAGMAKATLPDVTFLTRLPPAPASAATLMPLFWVISKQ